MTKIPLNDNDLREALRLIRAKQMAHAMLHAAEEQLTMFTQQIETVYQVPAGYALYDYAVGFVPVEELPHDQQNNQ